jgi:hypothetical protein
MMRLRKAGYSEEQRASYLKEVHGVRDLSDLELHRDSYLAWREQTDEDRQPDRVRDRRAPRSKGRSR